MIDVKFTITLQMNVKETSVVQTSNLGAVGS